MSSSNQHNNNNDIYHFNNFSYAMSPRIRTNANNSNNNSSSANNVRSQLATPFNAQPHVSGINRPHQTIYDTSSSSEEAVEDAEEGFRPFPENGDYYPVNTAVYQSSASQSPIHTNQAQTQLPAATAASVPLQRPPPRAVTTPVPEAAGGPHSPLSFIRAATDQLDDHARRNTNLFMGQTPQQQQQQQSRGAVYVNDNGDAHSDSSSITATDVEFVNLEDEAKKETYPNQHGPYSQQQHPMNEMPGAFITGDNENDNNGNPNEFEEQPIDFAVPEEYKLQEAPKPKLVEKKFVTYRGNLILDSETSAYLLRQYALQEPDNEFTYMRYSSITCQPNEFVAKNYDLRQNFYAVRRETELLICVTLYNEEPHLVARTLKGVFQNINHLTKLKHSRVWGKDSWKKVVVCLVADGRNKIDKKTLALFSAIGVYQDGFARGQLGDKDIQAHLYEHTTMLGLSATDENNISFKKNNVPVQLLFCLKEKNKKKINSHRWCFEAFAPVLNPRVVVLLDAGTQPTKDSLYNLWNSFYMDPQVGGACGEIKAALGPKFINLLNPLVAAQNFEYKISNILDKPTESVFGFISVLPGAFSAYRYHALLNDEDGIGPLEKYFKGEELDSDASAGVFQKNMYLAEDRILCFELVAKKKWNWKLKYVKSACAETDTPTAISALVKQRRRWLNGSFFASFYSLTHFYRIWTSGHSVMRKFWLQVEFIYQAVQLVISWFSIACFFIVFRILTKSLEDYFGGAKILAGIFLWIYVATTVITFVISFGNRPEGTSKVYFAMLLFYAILMSYTMFAAIFLSVKAVQDFVKEKSFQEMVFHNSRFRDLVVSMASTYVLYFVASFLYFEPWHMFTSFLQYLLISPTYINVLNIYAFCNLHDLSWGSRDDEIKDDLKPAKVEQINDKEDEAVAGNEFLISMDAPIEQEEVNDQYMKQLGFLMKPSEPNFRYNKLGMKVKIDHTDRKTKEKDYYALIRSLVVIFWMGTNVCLIAVVLSMDGFTETSAIKKVYERRSEVFLTVILWIVAFLAAFRFLGCMIYLVNNIHEKWVEFDIRFKNKTNSKYLV